MVDGFPCKKYSVVYADPPWTFSSRELQTYGGKRFTPLSKHYPTQHRDWIAQLPVEQITNPDCALFLWTTDAHIAEALGVMSAWGFRYVTVAFVWEKKSKTGKTLTTLGAWTLKSCELCLLGTKGAMVKHKKTNNVRQKVDAERTTHSKKPQQVRTNIELLFGDLPRIELFAREVVAGWDAWGDEA